MNEKDRLDAKRKARLVRESVERDLRQMAANESTRRLTSKRPDGLARSRRSIVHQPDWLYVSALSEALDGPVEFVERPLEAFCPPGSQETV